MSIVPIERFGAEVLDRRASELTEFSSDLDVIAQDMIETMYAAPGVGLAAPQIGLGIRLMVIDITVGEDPGQVIVMANPVMVEMEGDQHEEEGCLSVPGYSGVVSRPAWVKVRGQDLKGQEITLEGEGLLARAFCHEIDHLDGKLFLERLGVLKRDLIKRKIRKKIRQGDW
ncbi:MAG TPA: peptide deformylase [Vicinamibacteria bacterium]|jgi:peptide deformylase|nr:peptide deformylase [Vicinamibacteria bacterium]